MWRYLRKQGDKKAAKRRKKVRSGCVAHNSYSAADYVITSTQSAAPALTKS